MNLGNTDSNSTWFDASDNLPATSGAPSTSSPDAQPLPQREGRPRHRTQTHDRSSKYIFHAQNIGFQDSRHDSSSSILNLGKSRQPDIQFWDGFSMSNLSLNTTEDHVFTKNNDSKIIASISDSFLEKSTKFQQKSHPGFPERLCASTEVLVSQSQPGMRNMTSTPDNPADPDFSYGQVPIRSLSSVNLPISGRSSSAKRKEPIHHDGQGVSNPNKRLNTGERPATHRTTARGPPGPSTSDARGHPRTPGAGQQPNSAPDHPGVKQVQAISMTTNQDGSAQGRSSRKDNFAFRQNQPDYPSDSDEDGISFEENFNRILNDAERTLNNHNNGNDSRPRRDLSPLNLSTPQKNAWNQVRATRNKIADHQAFKAFLLKCKEEVIFPDIVSFRRPPPGIFSTAPQTWDREFQDIWNQGLKACSMGLLDSCLSMSTLKLELLNASLDSNVTHLRGLLSSNRPQFERVMAIIERLVETYTTRANTKYNKMVDNLRAKTLGDTNAPGSSSGQGQGQGQGQSQSRATSRRRDFPNQRTTPANQARGGNRGPSSNRGRPKTQSRFQGQRAPSWTPQTHSNSNAEMLSNMMATMMAMMNQGQQAPQRRRGPSNPPPSKRARKNRQ